MIGDGSDDNVKIPESRKVLDIRQRTGGKIINDVNGIAALHTPLSQVRADETCTARNQNVHFPAHSSGPLATSALNRIRKALAQPFSQSRRSRSCLEQPAES